MDKEICFRILRILDILLKRDLKKKVVELIYAGVTF
jgi:hypothetical protein